MLAAVERTRHTEASHGQIMALNSRARTFNPSKLVPPYPAAALEVEAIQKGCVGDAVWTERIVSRSNQSIETQLQVLIHSLRALIKSLIHYGL